MMTNVLLSTEIDLFQQKMKMNALTKNIKAHQRDPFVSLV